MYSVKAFDYFCIFLVYGTLFLLVSTSALLDLIWFVAEFCTEFECYSLEVEFSAHLKWCLLFLICNRNGSSHQLGNIVLATSVTSN